MLYNDVMKSFSEFMMLLEQDPLGGPPPGGPMGGGPPGGPMGGGPPGGPMGGGPPGGPMGGGPPGGPMGGPPGGGAMGAQQPPMKIVPQTVWDVLEKILTGKPVEDKESQDKKPAMPPPGMPPGGPPGAPPGGPQSLMSPPGF